ncbi:MAG: 3-dehydroquinate synthase [Candidatus Omnitrophota bacterium]
MKTATVNLPQRPYSIISGGHIIPHLGAHLKRLKIGNDAYIITNSLIEHKYGKLIEEALRKEGFTVKFKCVRDTEKSKSLKTAAHVLNNLAFYDKKRSIFIVALGGGVIGDLSGFIASIYKRGVPYINIPTTLLAQIDSSIGGKTAVDLEAGKNLVGSFYQPRLVFSDISFLSSLDQRQIRAGLAEVIKYGIIGDEALFRYLEKNCGRLLARDVSALEFIVKRCSAIKAGIIEQDEYETKGIRTVLNFGHTIGHALEAAAHFNKYNHGEAIALGMLVASEISSLLGLITAASVNRIEKLLSEAGLPVRITGIAMNDILRVHYRDKKFSGTRNKFVLIEGIGKVIIKQDIPLEVIKQALQKRSARYFA